MGDDQFIRAATAHQQDVKRAYHCVWKLARTVATWPVRITFDRSTSLTRSSILQRKRGEPSAGGVAWAVETVENAWLGLIEPLSETGPDLSPHQ